MTAKRAATRAARTSAGRRASRHDPGVVAFLRELDHPRKPAIEALRELVLDARPDIVEGIKWNAPSFGTTTADHFATFHLRATDRVLLILHTGAKKRARATPPAIDDPSGLLEWRGPDRCIVTIIDARDLRAKRTALTSILRQWLEHLDA